MTQTKFKWIALIAATTVAWAGEPQTSTKDKDLKKVLEEQGIYVETSKPGIKLSGYVDAGYTYNFTSRNALQPTRGGNDGANASENGGDFNIHNFKVVLEKALPEENTWAAGFRADVNYGEDALLKAANTAGDGASGLWLQQAYVNFNIPVGNGLQMKFGKWSALTGFEAPERPANPNITGGLVAAFEPGEHVGLLGTYAVNKNLSLNLGLANPDWGNNAVGVSFAHGGKGTTSILYTGSAVVQTDSKEITSKFILVYNPNGGAGILQNNTPAGAANQVLNEGESLLFNHNTMWMPSCCNNKLMLGYNAVLGFYNDYARSAIGVTPREYNESYWGTAGYAKYLFNSVFSLAQRVEYVTSNDGAKLGTVGSALTPTNLTGKNSEALGFTTTAGFNLWENMLLRFEYRADFTHLNDSAPNSISRDGDATVAHLAAAQVVYSF